MFVCVSVCLSVCKLVCCCCFLLLLFFLFFFLFFFFFVFLFVCFCFFFFFLFFSLKDFSGTIPPRILKFSTNIEYDLLDCVRENQYLHVHYSL